MTMESGATQPPESAVALGDRAMEDLRFIRDAMEQGASFTAVPGWGGVLMGVTAFGAAALASRQDSSTGWMLVWLVEAAVAIGIESIAIQRKAKRANLPVFSGAGRKFALSFLPPAVAGMVLTAALWRTGDTALLPGVWLLLYGVSVVTAGTFSVKVVPRMGMCFMALGAVALAVAPMAGNLMMALGFGGLHVVFGILIARRHGG